MPHYLQPTITDESLVRWQFICTEPLSAPCHNPEGPDGEPPEQVEWCNVKEWFDNDGEPELWFWGDKTLPQFEVTFSVSTSGWGGLGVFTPVTSGVDDDRYTYCDECTSIRDNSGYGSQHSGIYHPKEME